MNNTNSSMDNKQMIQSGSLVLPTWTNHDQSLFLHAIANGPDDIAGKWQEMANLIPGKTADEVKAYYEAVERDLHEIEAGRVELPVYVDDEDDGMGKEEIVRVKKEEKLVANSGSGSLGAVNIGKKGVEKVRRKASPWTEGEHRKFLQGLQIYGKGDWRSIARNIVITRTASQVASHAQKYFLRQASLKEDDKKEEGDNNKRKKRRRSSIHDIRTPDEVVHAQPSSSTAPTTTLNGVQGRGVPAAAPSISSPAGSQGRGGQSSLTIWPGKNGITNTDTTMVVHAQPISSTPPATTSTFNGGSEGRRVPTAVPTLPPPYFCGGQGRGVHALASNFYGGLGGVGGPQPLNSFYSGHGGGASSYPAALPPTRFYGGQGQVPRYEFIKHVAPTHVKGYPLDEEFSFKNSYLSETNL